MNFLSTHGWKEPSVQAGEGAGRRTVATKNDNQPPGNKQRRTNQPHTAWGIPEGEGDHTSTGQGKSPRAHLTKRMAAARTRYPPT